MLPHICRSAAVLSAAALSLLVDQPALAADTVLSQSKALVGNITPGDAPGFPITISLSGSYVFDGSIVPPAGTTGINISASDVTIDFRSHALLGRDKAHDGIYMSGTNLVIHDGTIAGFKHAALVGDFLTSVIRT